MNLQASEGILVRIATLDDVDAIAAMFDAYRQFYEQPADIALAKRFVSDRLAQRQSVIFLAQTPQGHAVGFCQIYPSFCSVIAQPIAVLYDLFVAPTTRRNGAARALLQAADYYAIEQGFARLDLTTAKNNMKAQALYESEGWSRDEIFYAYSKTPKI